MPTDPLSAQSATQIGPYRYGEATRIAADIIARHYRKPAVGAERGQTGKYAAYFFDENGDEFRSVGGFPTVGDAARAIPFIVAETVIEDVAVWDADSADHDAPDEERQS